MKVFICFLYLFPTILFAAICGDLDGDNRVTDEDANIVLMKVVDPSLKEIFVNCMLMQGSSKVFNCKKIALNANKMDFSGDGGVVGESNPRKKTI